MVREKKSDNQRGNEKRFGVRNKHFVLGLSAALLVGASATLILWGSGRAACGWVVFTAIAGQGLVALIVCRK